MTLEVRSFNYFVSQKNDLFFSKLPYKSIIKKPKGYLGGVSGIYLQPLYKELRLCLFRYIACATHKAHYVLLSFVSLEYNTLNISILIV